MERRWSGWLAAVILGAIWGLWHLPAFYISTLPQSAFGFPLFLIQAVALSVLMAWCVNHARGSLIPAILLHWAINRFAGLDPATAPYTAAFFVAAALIVIVAGGRELGRRHMPAPP
jgi:membrane protease YdiL (CAAX protease family)